MIPDSLEKIAFQWGPGVLILMVFAFGFLKLATHWIDRWMEVKREQTDGTFAIARDYIGQLATAQKSQAEAISRLAGTVEHRDSLESYEHQEILIALKAVHRNVASLLDMPLESEGPGAKLARRGSVG